MCNTLNDNRNHTGRPQSIITKFCVARARLLSRRQLRFFFFSNVHFPIVFQSPAPVCMFYFAHPFGISSASSRSAAAAAACHRHRSHTQSSSVMTSASSTTASSRAMPTPFQGHRYMGRGGYWHCMTASSSIDRNESANSYLDNHVRAYVPWPMDTWRREFILPPIVGVLHRQRGKLSIAAEAQQSNLILICDEALCHIAPSTQHTRFEIKKINNLQ